jgi:hypothetical protein
MAVDTLEMAQAMRKSGLPQEQAETIAEQIAKGVANDELATKEFVRAEIAAFAATCAPSCTGRWACSPGRRLACSCSRRGLWPRRRSCSDPPGTAAAGAVGEPPTIPIAGEMGLSLSLSRERRRHDDHPHDRRGGTRAGAGRLARAGGRPAAARRAEAAAHRLRRARRGVARERRRPHRRDRPRRRGPLFAPRPGALELDLADALVGREVQIVTTPDELHPLVRASLEAPAIEVLDGR